MLARASKPAVSACLIVRNEERFLEGCLQSVAGHIDEMVVVDTGSSDRTKDIARAFGARLLEQPWRDDFAAARNVGIDAATGDWILYIDADERLTVPADSRLSDGLERADAIAARPLFRPRLGATPYREYRLFRRDPRLRFQGAIHETIKPALLDIVHRDGAAVIDVAAMITHLGYEGDQSHKHRRNLPMLRRAVVDDPARIYYWHHLAETLAATGAVSEALDVCERGLDAARRHGDPLQTAIVANLAVTYAGLLRQTGGDPMPVIDEALSLHPGQKALLLLKARALIDRGEPRRALAIVHELTRIDPDDYLDPVVSYDRRIFGAYAHDLTGVALLRLGERAAAAEAFARAAAAEPADPSYRRKAEALGLARSTA